MMGTPTTPNIAEDSTLVTTFEATTNATQRNQKKGKSGVTSAINQDTKGRLVGSYMEKQQTERATNHQIRLMIKDSNLSNNLSPP